MDYGKAYWIQKRLHQRRVAGLTRDVLILVEHAPVLTMGRDAGREHILVGDDVLQRHGILIYQVERGGDVTYHGPGQLVGYPVLDLTRWGRDLHGYVRRLEEVIIRTLACYGVTAGRREGYPGVWVGDKKVAALGVAVKRWVTMHGFAFNINSHLEHFQFIVPCGISEYGVTSLAEVLGQEQDFREVSRVLKKQFAGVFGIELVPVALDGLLFGDKGLPKTGGPSP